MPPKGGWLRAAPTVAATPLTKTAQVQVAEDGRLADADNNSLTKNRGVTCNPYRQYACDPTDTSETMCAVVSVCHPCRNVAWAQ